jgi:hypothetical protein
MEETNDVKRSSLWMALLLVMAVGARPMQVQAQADLFLEGTVFLDADGDGQRQAEEPGIGGVMVTLEPLGSAPMLFSVDTDPLGLYRFESLEPGSYAVEVQPPDGYFCVPCQVQIDLISGQPLSVDLALRESIPLTPTSTPSPTPSPLPSPTPGNPIITFYVSPDTTHYPGDCATLYWAVDRAAEVFLLLPSGQVGVEGSGQQQVCPPATTTYRLKVNSLHGSQEIVEALVVVPPPPTSTPVPTLRPPPQPKPTRPASATATPTLPPTTTPTPTLTLVPPPTQTPLPTPVDDPLLSGLPVQWQTIDLIVPAGTEPPSLPLPTSPSPEGLDAPHGLFLRQWIRFALPQGYQAIEGVDSGCLFYHESLPGFLVLYPSAGEPLEILSNLQEATTSIRRTESPLVVEIGGRSFRGLFVETQSGGRLFLAATEGWGLVTQGPVSTWSALAAGLNQVLLSISFEEER